MSWLICMNVLIAASPLCDAVVSTRATQMTNPGHLHATTTRFAALGTAETTATTCSQYSQDCSESGGDSRQLSIIFFAVSALLTLASIVVAVVHGSSAAHAAQRLSNVLIASLHEGSRSLDVEMAGRTNADQVPNSSFTSTMAPA